MRLVSKFKRTWDVVQTILFILFIIPIALFYIFLLLLLSPYHLYYYTANWGLAARDFPAVQLYLDHFEALHPQLMARVAEHLRSAEFSQRPVPERHIKFWPTLTEDRHTLWIPMIAVVRTTHWTFTVASGLFMLLESAAVSRKDLWDLLEREVESKVPGLAEEQKQRFKKVKAKVCDHNLFNQIAFFKLRRNTEVGFVLPSDYAGRITVVKNKKIDWILDDGHPLVVPMDVTSFRLLRTLKNLLPIWRVINKDEDLQKTSTGWQMLDLREGTS
ncbi:hypothetical protein BX600DRAFT_439059 [Xylariales sp. PMI_506]|nr:hypothetical protein BX600DRAFT_439059 [Xylariales sp. PMI_506]